MQIVYENKHLVIVSKTPGELSEVSMDGNDVVTLASKAIGISVYPVNRLDRGTGGLTILAKTKEDAALLSSDSVKDTFTKEYLCVVSGVHSPENGEMVDFLFTDKRQGKVFPVKSERKGSKKASLSYETLEKVSFKENTYSLLKVTLHTGRTHQIRVQTASRKHPIVGDGKYGSRVKAPFPALWSFHTKLTYLGENISVNSYPPSQFPWNLFERIGG